MPRGLRFIPKLPEKRDSRMRTRSETSWRRTYRFETINNTRYSGWRTEAVLRKGWEIVVR